MKKGIVVIILFIALIVGFVGGYFSYPFVQGFQEGYAEVIEQANQALVKANMKTFNIVVECYKIDSGFYPKNSDISWAREELPPNFKNPYTKAKGEAYVSGKPTKLGVIGYESNDEGTEYVIYGYGVDWVLITPETHGEFNKVPINVDWE